MQDRIETIGNGTIIQHGKVNDRIYLMEMDREDFPEILEQIRLLARENGYTKIFARVPEWAAPSFFSEGYMMEAFIPGFYHGQESAFFLSRYLDPDRLLEVENDSLLALSGMLENGSPSAGNGSPTPARSRNNGRPERTPPARNGGPAPAGKDVIPEVIRLDGARAGEITGIYRRVFRSYPFPIHDPAYILETMKDDFRYYGMEIGGRLAAVASADTHIEERHAEMTDFATLPEFRGRGLSTGILRSMEQEMKKEGILTLYTIARLNSPAINRTFLRLDYTYAGTLIRNTNIAGRIESMNVYYKHV